VVVSDEFKSEGIDLAAETNRAEHVREKMCGAHFFEGHERSSEPMTKPRKGMTE